MDILLIVIIILLVLINLYQKKKNKNTIENETVQNIENNKEEKYPPQNYQRKWMFSYNEKDAYRRIKEITNQAGLELFVKVRLLDLIEPRNNIHNFKAHLWKIQAKHVDFVICDNKLVAKYIIELDDNSHNNSQRIERDNFVDEVLRATGYKILHIRSIDNITIKEFLEIKGE